MGGGALGLLTLCSFPHPGGLAGLSSGPGNSPSLPGSSPISTGRQALRALSSWASAPTLGKLSVPGSRLLMVKQQSQGPAQEPLPEALE